MVGKRDEFPISVQRTVAERAAYICSNPDCRDWTVEPHSDPEKSLKTGEAAHICAASSGGPRYDPTQTSAERASIHNAIWLCTKCSTTIDKDAVRYPAPLVLGWKQIHEDWLRNGGVVPAPPEFSIRTLNGFTLPDIPGTIALRKCEDLREHHLRVQNNSATAALLIDARLQMPEPIVAAWVRERPPGLAANFRPRREDIVISGTGTVTRNRPPLPSTVFQLSIDRLPPTHTVEIAVFTSMSAYHAHDLTLDSGPFAEMTKGDYLLQFIDVRFQFDYRGATITKRFFAPISFDKPTRAMSVIEVREDKGDWKPVEITLMS